MVDVVGRERERTITVVSVAATVVAVMLVLAATDNPVTDLVDRLRGVDGRVRPAVEAEGGGSYAFLDTQDGGERPVGFDPCREIHYVVNPLGAPDGWQTVVAEAVATVEDASGLGFTYDGETDDRDFDDRVGSFSRAKPVLIGWAEDGEVSDLADDVAGIGGPTVLTVGRLRGYVSGSVVLDQDVTDSFGDGSDGRALHRALLLHELGHLVGLDHVDDPNELMYPRGISARGYGPGDLAGLAALGAVPCSR